MRKVSSSSKGNKTFTALLSSSRIKVSGQSVRGRGDWRGGGEEELIAAVKRNSRDQRIAGTERDAAVYSLTASFCQV